jgi:hypothetical protein
LTDQTLIDEKVAAGGGKKITDAADAAKAKIPGLISGILGKCAGKPWGTDDAGQQFVKSAKFDTFPDTVTRVAQHADAIGVLGHNIQTGVAKTVDADWAARDWVVATNITAGKPL